MHPKKRRSRLPKKQVLWPIQVWIVSSVDILSNEWFITRNGAVSHAERLTKLHGQEFEVKPFARRVSPRATSVQGAKEKDR